MVIAFTLDIENLCLFFSGSIFLETSVIFSENQLLISFLLFFCFLLRQFHSQLPARARVSLCPLVSGGAETIALRASSSSGAGRRSVAAVPECRASRFWHVDHHFHSIGSGAHEAAGHVLGPPGLSGVQVYKRLWGPGFYLGTLSQAVKSRCARGSVWCSLKLIIYSTSQGKVSSEPAPMGEVLGSTERAAAHCPGLLPCRLGGAPQAGSED